MKFCFNPIALRMAKTLWSFGRSECNRVKMGFFFQKQSQKDPSKMEVDFWSILEENPPSYNRRNTVCAVIDHGKTLLAIHQVPELKYIRSEAIMKELCRLTDKLKQLSFIRPLTFFHI